MNSTSNRLIFGCGYLGRRVARRWLQEGHRVHAVTRFPARAAEFLREGIEPHVADITDPGSLRQLPEATTVLFAVGFARGSSNTIDDVFVEGLRNVLNLLPAAERFIHISSSGVYGQQNGLWVDESSPCRPVRAGGRACLGAEQLLMRHAQGQRAVVLRLAGLYGPGRIPRRDDLLRGVPIAAPATGFLNLIHVDDAVDTVLAAEQLAPVPRLYLVSDGTPVPRRHYFAELARQLGAAEPRFITPDPNNHSAGRAMSNKRIRNQRLRDELKVRLSFPSYVDGLAAILGDISSAGDIERPNG